MIFAIALVLALAVAPAAARKAKRVTCPPGRYLVQDQALAGAPSGALPDVLVVGADGRAAIASGCPPHAVRGKPRRDGMALRVKWPAGACAGLRGNARLRGRLDAACTTFRGTLKAKGHRRAFTARLSVCGDGYADVAGGETCDLETMPCADPARCRLDGPPDAPAVTATTMVTPTPAPPGERSVAPDGSTVIRTRLELGFDPGATVAQVNAILAGAQATIDGMLPGTPLLLIRVPDPGTLDALDAVVAALVADPAVRWARREHLPARDVVPDNFAPPAVAPPVAPHLDRIAHHLAVGAGAAWNARAAMTSPPLVVVQDYFGDGVPDGAYDVTTGPLGFAAGAAESHGYHVLGIVAGAFGGDACPFVLGGPPSSAVARGCATGIVPGTTPVAVADLAAGLGGAAGDIVALQHVAAAGGNAILNTSLGCVPCVRDPAEAAAAARSWIEKVRGLGLETRFLHATSAGNVDAPGESADAVTNSAYTAAALLPGLLAADGTPIAPLTNVLVVENARRTGEPYAARCLASGSKFPGDVAAIGSDVWSLVDAGGTATCSGPPSGTCARTCSQDGDACCEADLACHARPLSGTSMAAPQVAGLAAYLWAIVPDMTVEELRGALLAAAMPGVADTAPDCQPTRSAPTLDAWAAVLSLDQATTPTRTTAPVRHALLDVLDDGTFDALDVEAALIEYVEGYVDGANHGAPRQPGPFPDHGRFDLNGDGFTGGAAHARPFDLDRTGSTRFGAPSYDLVTTTIAGRPHVFDERALTDLEILCWYAHSPLYAGDPAARDRAIDPAWCNPVELETTFSTHVRAGSGSPLFVQGFRRDARGAQRPLSGARVEITPSGGTVDDLAGVLDADGHFETLATAFAGADVLELRVVLRAGDGTLLAEETVAATVLTGPAVVFGNTTVYASAAAGAWDENGVSHGDTDGAELPVAADGVTTVSAGAAIARGEQSGVASATATVDVTREPDGTLVLRFTGQADGSASGGIPTINGSGGGSSGVDLPLQIDTGGAPALVTIEGALAGLGSYVPTRYQIRHEGTFWRCCISGPSDRACDAGFGCPSGAMPRIASTSPDGTWRVELDAHATAQGAFPQTSPSQGTFDFTMTIGPGDP